MTEKKQESEQTPKKSGLNERQASVESTLSIISHILRSAAAEGDEALLAAFAETRRRLYVLEEAIVELRIKRISSLPPPRISVLPGPNEITIPAPPLLPTKVGQTNPSSQTDPTDLNDPTDPPPPTQRSAMLASSHARPKSKKR